MKISAVIPAHRDQTALLRGIRTLQRQTYKLHEIVLVDDGSPKPLHVPPGIRLVRIDRDPYPRSTSIAKNYGASLATGDWLLFCYDDIWHLPDAVECLVRRAESLNREDILLNTLAVGVRDLMKQRRITERWLMLRAENARSELIRAVVRCPSRTIGYFFEQHCGLIKKSYFDALGGYDETSFRGWGMNDQDLCIRVARSGGLVDSHIRRSSGLPLLCFHDYSREKTHEEVATRDAEFVAKYGIPWSPSLVLKPMRRHAA